MQVIGLVAVQCVLPFQHKFKCKNSNAALQRTIWSKVSLCALSRHLSSLLDISKKECNCRRLSLEWKYGALKRDEESLAVSHTHTHTNTHTHTHTRMHTHTHCLLPLCIHFLLLLSSQSSRGRSTTTPRALGTCQSWVCPRTLRWTRANQWRVPAPVFGPVGRKDKAQNVPRKNLNLVSVKRLIWTDSSLIIFVVL